MNNRTMAVHYARALAEALPGADDLQRVQRDLHRAATLLEESADLRTVVASPVAPSRRKKEAAERVFAAMEVHAATRRVMAMLAESGWSSEIFPRMGPDSVTGICVFSANSLRTSQAWL